VRAGLLIRVSFLFRKSDVLVRRGGDDDKGDSTRSRDDSSDDDESSNFRAQPRLLRLRPRQPVRQQQRLRGAADSARHSACFVSKGSLGR